jgi:hypothetical protein
MLSELQHDVIIFGTTGDGINIIRFLLTSVCMIAFVPFCLFYSQNRGYIGDKHAFHLRKRKTNR